MLNSGPTLQCARTGGLHTTYLVRNQNKECGLSLNWRNALNVWTISKYDSR